MVMVKKMKMTRKREGEGRSEERDAGEIGKGDIGKVVKDTNNVTSL